MNHTFYWKLGGLIRNKKDMVINMMEKYKAR